MPGSVSGYQEPQTQRSECPHDPWSCAVGVIWCAEREGSGQTFDSKRGLHAAVDVVGHMTV